MKKLLVCMLFIAFLVQMCPAAFTESIDTKKTYNNAYRWTGGSKDKIRTWAAEVEDRLTGVVGIEYSSYTATDTEPGTTAGMLYYDLSENKFKYYDGGSWVAIESGSSGNSLDGAYNVGSAITVDSATVGLTATNAADVIALTVTQQDTGSTVGQTIVSAGTGALLSFDSNGTGADILGSDSTWNITKAGVGTLVGLVTSTGDVTFTGAAYNIIHDASANQIEFQDSAELSFGTNDDISIVYDGSGNDLDITGSGLEIAIGANDEGMDVIFHGETASTYAMWDESADEIVLELADLKVSSDSQIEFEDDAGTVDWTIDNDTDETLLITPTETTDDQSINLGNATNTTDLRIFGATASTVIFDASADNVLFNAYDIQLQDDDVLAFGDGKDITLSQSSANLLTVGQTVAGTGSVAFGVNDAGLDLKLFGDTASAYWLWDTSADTMEVVGGNATITTDDAEANQFKVNATGAVAGIAVQLETTDGGIHLLADGATGGDITLDAEDDIILTTTGALTITNTDAMTISGALSPNGAVLGDGGDTLYGFKKEIEIEPGTSETVLATDTGKVFATTAGQGAVTYTLPSAVAGMVFTFVDVSATAADDLKIQAAAGDTINGGTAAKIYECVTDTIPATVTIVAIDATQWVVIAEVGTWVNNNS